jgi:hypothetical protein
LPPSTIAVKVAGVTVRKGSTSLSAVADVVLTTASGTPIANATVTGTWNGQAKGTSTAITNASGLGTTGQITVKRSGNVGFKVTSVTGLPAGYAWDGVLITGTAKI